VFQFSSQFLQGLLQENNVTKTITPAHNKSFVEINLISYESFFIYIFDKRKILPVLSWISLPVTEDYGSATEKNQPP